MQTVDTIRRGDVAFRVVGLGPSSDARAIFEGLLQRGEFKIASDSGFDEQGGSSDAVANELPVALLVLGGCFFLALAAHERFAGRLALPTARRARGSA